MCNPKAIIVLFLFLVVRFNLFLKFQLKLKADVSVYLRGHKLELDNPDSKLFRLAGKPLVNTVILFFRHSLSSALYSPCNHIRIRIYYILSYLSVFAYSVPFV